MPLFSIDNGTFSATIDSVGAQLVSLKRNNSGEEFIWQRDEAFWAESAPICFPIVGNLKDGGFEHNGQWFTIKKHGCVRYMPFFMARHTAKSLALSAVANIETKKSYPFSFKLTVCFTLEDDGLRVSYLVENMGTEDMPMSLGYHPAFALNPNVPLSDYSIRFSEKETLDLHGILEGGFGLRQEKYLNNRNNITLTETLFDQDALVFKNINSTSVTLEQANSDWQIEVETGGAPHLAIWSKPRAPFVCIEPWYICPDEADAPKELSKKPDIKMLAPSDSFKSAYKIKPSI